jgi:hypothetical protein
MVYLVAANSPDVSGPHAGALVAGGFAFSSPGKKNDAGETLWLALMPPQPPSKKGIGSSIANRRNFQFNLTCPL